MAAASGLSWFEFLFNDKTDLLKDHLKDPSADPSAAQLIVQFLERSGISSPTSQAAGPTQLVDNKRGKRLKELALQVGFHLKWNLEAFEESLSLHWQNLFFNELLKLQIPSYQNVKNGVVSLGELDKKSAMALIIYCRWVIRTLAQHFLPNIGKPKTNMLEAAENENTLRNLKEQLSTSISILEDTLGLNEDLELPCPLEQNTTITETPATSTSATATGTIEKDDNGPGIKDSGLKRLNGETVKIAEIKAQVSFDLGTLYFYQEKFEKAAKLFQHCKEAKCCSSSCYTVKEDILHGYYMSCCGLLDTATDAMFKSDVREHKTSLLEQVHHYKSSSYKDLMQVLIDDNIEQELPMDYRRWLEFNVEDLASQMMEQSVSLQWQISACNNIRLVLEGQQTDSVFWSSLKTGTKHNLECVLSLSVETFQRVQQSPEKFTEADNDSVFQILRSFVCLMCSSVDNGFQIAQISEANIFLKDMMAVDNQNKDKIERNEIKWNAANVYPDVKRENMDLKCGYLLQRLRLSFDPHEINSIVGDLHQIQPSRRFHTENFTCMIYKSYLDDIQDIALQDLLHIIFSKSLHCCSMKEYELSVDMLKYALGRLALNNACAASAIERVKMALNQELLVIDLKKTSNRTEELVNQVKSYLHQTKNEPDLLPHVQKLSVVYLLNNKELTFLSNLKMDSKEFGIDYRTLGSLLADACLSVTKPQQWRKSTRLLWDGVLRIFSSTVQQKRPQDGRSAITIRRDATNINLSSFVDFVDQIQEETCLAVVISCLVRLHNLSKEGQENYREIFSSYAYLWPTSITNRSSVNFEHIDYAMMHTTKHAVKVCPWNATWQQTLGDIYLDSNNFSSALKCYLEAGACSSLLFSLSIPLTVWDTQIFKKMVECCMELKAYIQAASLCQCLEPKDYTTAFKAIKLAAATSSEDAMDQYYMLFWDVTMLEYLINTHFQQGQQEKKLLAIQTISQAELNIFNNQDILDHAEQIRKTSLFRALAKQYL